MGLVIAVSKTEVTFFEVLLYHFFESLLYHMGLFGLGKPGCSIHFSAEAQTSHRNPTNLQGYTH